MLLSCLVASCNRCGEDALADGYWGHCRADRGAADSLRRYFWTYKTDASDAQDAYMQKS